MDETTHQDHHQNSHRPMTPFDRMVTPPFLYTLKLLLPYTPPSMQRFLAFYIKFIELRSTMEHFRGFPARSLSMDSLEDLKPYLDPSEKEMMEQMAGMMHMMEMIQGMQSMQGSDSQDMKNADPMDILQGMLTPEQQEMFQMYNTMFAQEMGSSEAVENQEQSAGHRPDHNPADKKGESDNE